MQKGVTGSQYMRASRGFGFLRKLYRTVLHMPPLRLAQVIFQNLVPQRILDINVIMVRSRRLHVTPSKPNNDVGIRWLTPGDVPMLAEVKNEDPRFIESRLSEGHRAVVVEIEGEIVGYNWCVPGTYKIGWLSVALPPKCYFKSDMWVSPEHRGQRLAGRMSDFGLRDYYEKGFRHSFACTDALNSAARSHEKN